MPAQRIPQSFIDELLTRVDIVSVIEPFVPLKKNGANYVARCPFHQEKSPSFTVSPAKQIYHCFGCGVSGNAISFLMEYERQSFVESIETLASQVGMEIPRVEGDRREYVTVGQDSYQLMEQAAKFYYQALKKSPEVIEYLKKRGLSGEVAKHFSIGFAPAGWDHLIKQLGQGQESRKALLTTGMVIQKEEGSYYDRFRNRVMFPIRDRRGRVIAFGGRVLNDELPKYLNSPETPIFHKGSELYGYYEARKANRTLKYLMVVEGYMDVVALAQHGINYAVATLGTSITATHVERLFRTAPKIVFSFDGDKAGREAAWRALEIMMPILRDEWQPVFMFLPEGEDPDSVVRAEGREQFESRINTAETLSDFFLRQLSSRIDLDKMDGRARLVSLALPYIKRMPQNMMQMMLIKELSKKVSIDEAKLSQYLLPDQRAAEEQGRQAEGKIPSILRIGTALLLQNPALLKHVPEGVELTLRGGEYFNKLVQLLREQPALTTGAILEHWRDQPEGGLFASLANYNHMVSEQNLESYFFDALKKLTQQQHDLTIERLLDKAAIEGLSEQEKQQLQSMLNDRS